MMVVESIRKALVPIHREGYPFIGIGAAVTLVLAFFSTSLAWIAGILTVWVCYFFRDPPRVTPVRDGLVVSPADGRVSLITTAVPPADLVALPQEPMTRISIFMNVFDCHVNRSPVPGRIVQAKYSPGLFLNAELDKASDDNERSSLVIETATGRVGVVQIAGLVARRIVSFVREGETLEVGQRFGLIRFGSRVDVYLPLGTQPLVGFGQIATAGETVLADLKAQEPTRLYRAG